MHKPMLEVRRSERKTTPMRDKRKHPRKPGSTSVRFWRLPTDRSTIEYLEGVVENVALGGVFIATDDPLPKDSLVEVEFRVDADGTPRTVRAKALVRWARSMFPPAGMGLEFIEFSGLGQEHLEDWIARLKDSE